MDKESIENYIEDNYEALQLEYISRYLNVEEHEDFDEFCQRMACDNYGMKCDNALDEYREGGE